MSDKYKRYLFEYNYDGATWGFEVIAVSPADAMDRVKRMVCAQYKGEIAAKVPVPAATWLRRIATKISGGARHD